MQHRANFEEFLVFLVAFLVETNYLREATKFFQYFINTLGKKILKWKSGGKTNDDQGSVCVSFFIFFPIYQKIISPPGGGDSYSKKYTLLGQFKTGP